MGKGSPLLCSFALALPDCDKLSPKFERDHVTQAAVRSIFFAGAALFEMQQLLVPGLFCLCQEPSAGPRPQCTLDFFPSLSQNDVAVSKYCVRKGGGNWIVDAAAYDHWMRLKEDFIFFTMDHG